MQCSISQELFLANQKKKTKLISILSSKLEKSDFIVKQASDDADTLIINTTIDLSLYIDIVIVFGEDIDLLIILIGLSTTINEIFFVKPGKGKIDRRIYSNESLKLPQEFKKKILFMHAFGGCDTTSSFYRKGEIQCFKLIEKRPYLLSSIKAFYKFECK